MTSPAAEARAKVTAAHPEAVVSERGRNFIKHRLADVSDGRQRFALNVAIGPLHYGSGNDQEIDTALVPSTAPWDWEMTKAGFEVRALSDLSAGQVIEYRSDSEWVRFQPMALQYSNDLNQIQQIAMPGAVDATVDDDTLTWADGYGSGRSLSWQAQTARLEKILTIDTLADLPAVDEFILNGGNPVLELNLIFAHSNGVTPYVNGQEWKQGERDTQGLVEFRDDQGKVLWWFNLPRSWDSEGNEQLGTFRFKKQGNSLYVSHRVPLSFVQGAVYPLMVDVTVDEQVGSGNDDADEKSDDTGFNGTAVIARIIRHTTPAFRSFTGLRWTTVAVPQGATIDTAYVELYSYQFISDDMHSDILGNDVDDAVSFVTDADVTSRTRTAASVAWNGDSLGTGFVGSNIEIKTVIKEIVDRGSWTSDNALCILIDGHVGAGSWFYASTYERNTAQAANLYIEYTAGGGGTTITVPTVTLTISRFAPATKLAIIPPTRILALATFTPVLGLSVIPPPRVLSLATFTPTVTVTENQSIAPPSLTLVLSIFAPTVSTPVVITSPIIALALSTFAPTATATSDVTVTPFPLALTLSALAPVIQLSVIPPTLAISSVTFAPIITAPLIVTLPTLALSLATFAPAVTITGNQFVTPPALALSLTEFVPVIGLSVVSPTQTLILSAFAPTVTVIGNQIVTPPTLTLPLTVFVPVIPTVGGTVVTPPTLALLSSTFAPIVEVGVLSLVAVMPNILVLSLLGKIPIITSTTFISFGVPFLFIATDWDSGIKFFLEVNFKTASGIAKARLWNDTDGVVVAGSSLDTTSTSLVLLRSSALSLIDGKNYLVQLNTENVANRLFKTAKIFAVQT